MTENNIHRLGNKTFRLWYDISLIRNDSRARIAVCPALFPTLFTAFMPKISPLVSLVEKLWAFGSEPVGNTAGQTAILALETFLINEISYQTLSFIT